MPTLWCGLLSCCDVVSHIMHFFERLSDNMNIAYVTKNNLAVRVGWVWAAVLVPTALKLVCASIEQRSSVIDFHESRLVQLSTITLADLPNKFFITSIPSSKQERAWLTASPNRSTGYLIKVAQGWKAVWWAEFSTIFNDCLVNLGREYQFGWIRGAQIVSRIIKQLEKCLSLLWDLIAS